MRIAKKTLLVISFTRKRAGGKHKIIFHARVFRGRDGLNRERNRKNHFCCVTFLAFFHINY